MRLTDEDRRVIHELMLDYQWYVTKFPAFYAQVVTYRYVGTKSLSPWTVLQGKFMGFAPLVLVALSDELPPGFTLLRTLDDRWMAWASDPQLRMAGPTSEFSARLWCARHCYLQQCCTEAASIVVEEQKLDETIRTASDLRGEGAYSL